MDMIYSLLMIIANEIRMRSSKFYQGEIVLYEEYQKDHEAYYVMFDEKKKVHILFNPNSASWSSGYFERKKIYKSRNQMFMPVRKKPNV